MRTLTEDSIKSILENVAVYCNKAGKAIAIKPTTLLIRPELLQEVAILHGISLPEALELIQRAVIDAYNKYDWTGVGE